MTGITRRPPRLGNPPPGAGSPQAAGRGNRTEFPESTRTEFPEFTLAESHNRTVGAIRARLVKLSLITERAEYP